MQITLPAYAQAPSGREILDLVEDLLWGKTLQGEFGMSIVDDYTHRVLGAKAIAAGVLYPVFGLLLSPIFAGSAMAMSFVSVVTNALRLRKGSL